MTIERSVIISNPCQTHTLVNDRLSPYYLRTYMNSVFINLRKDIVNFNIQFLFRTEMKRVNKQYSKKYRILSVNHFVITYSFIDRKLMFTYNRDRHKSHSTIEWMTIFLSKPNETSDIKDAFHSTKYFNEIK